MARRFVVTAMVTVALGLPACDGGNGDAASPSSRPSTTLNSEEQAVLDAYLAQLEAFYAATSPPNPNHPALLRTTSGALLLEVQARIEDLRRKGHAIRRSPRSVGAPAVAELNAHKAIVIDCARDADEVIDTSSGRVVARAHQEGRIQARLVRSGDEWRVDAIEITEVRERCAGTSEG